MGNIYSIWAEVKPAPGPERKKGGGEKMDVEEDQQELRGVKKKMRRQKGEKAEIPSSGFLLRPLVKVNEGCVQSSDTDYITAPLISTFAPMLHYV